MDEDGFEDLLAEMRDIRALLQLAFRDRLLEVKEAVFEDDQDQMEAFRLFCKGMSYRKIGDEVGVSHATVGRWVEEWRGHGLVHAKERRCIVTPDVLGI